jgi:hypothetical protein
MLRRDGGILTPGRTEKQRPGEDGKGIRAGEGKVRKREKSNRELDLRYVELVRISGKER